VILSSSAILIIKYTNMKKPLNKKLVVRITENQYHRLQQNILEDKVSMSQVIREALQNKLNKIEIDDTRKRKFRF
jgi:predicted HicB family RNase H-like nuclease